MRTHNRNALTLAVSVSAVSGFSLLALLAAGCSSGPLDTGAADMRAYVELDLSHVAMPDLRPPPPDLSLPLRDATVHPDPASVGYGNGHIIHTIDAITVTWAGDALGVAREQFVSWMVTSDYYYNDLNEYGVMKGSSRGLFTIKTPPPANLDDADVGALLRGAIATGDLPSPTSASTVYIIYLPENTTSTLMGEMGCYEYGGYHSETSINNGPVAYAIVPDCSNGMFGGGGNEIDSDTEVTSHEIAEAVTDPFMGGGYTEEVSHMEIGDLCVPLDVTMIAQIPDGGADGGIDGGTATYRVQRLWSEKAAEAGGDPCLPVPGAPYIEFNAGFDPNQIVITTDDSGKGSTTFQVEPFADGDVGQIMWRIDTSQAGPGISVTPSNGSGVPGSTQIVTAKATSSASPGTWPISIFAYLPSATGGHHSGGNVWFGSITVQ